MSLEDFKVYQCKSGLLPGHSYAAVIKVAWKVYNRIASRTKRRPYIRSAYFGGEKIFLDNFWPHLHQKNPTDRKRRLWFFQSALELIRNSKHKPILEKSSTIRDETLYRFLGEASGRLFVVQIKADLKRRQKFLMSCFGYSEK